MGDVIDQDTHITTIKLWAALETTKRFVWLTSRNLYSENALYEHFTHATVCLHILPRSERLPLTSMDKTGVKDFLDFLLYDVL
jgi:hypothetical protein